MIQSALVFILGFLTAALLALAAVPALWRRAVRLTRKRILASTPMSLNEIEAEKDRMRAAFAMEVRQTEMKLEASRDRIARLMVDLGAAQERARKDGERRTGSDTRVAGLERDLEMARAENARLTAALHIANEAIGGLEARQRELSAQNAQMAGALDEAALRAGQMQVDSAGREAAGDRRRASAPVVGPHEDVAALEAALASEKLRVAELERRLAASTETARAPRMPKIEVGDPFAPRPEGNVLSLDTMRLSAENATLREQVLDLAARVVALTAADEGEASPVTAALQAEDKGGRPSGLADRIRALQKSASSRRP